MAQAHPGSHPSVTTVSVFLSLSANHPPVCYILCRPFLFFLAWTCPQRSGPPCGSLGRASPRGPCACSLLFTGRLAGWGPRNNKALPRNFPLSVGLWLWAGVEHASEWPMRELSYVGGWGELLSGEMRRKNLRREVFFCSFVVGPGVSLGGESTADGRRASQLRSPQHFIWSLSNLRLIKLCSAFASQSALSASAPYQPALGSAMFEYWTWFTVPTQLYANRGGGLSPRTKGSLCVTCDKAVSVSYVQCGFGGWKVLQARQRLHDITLCVCVKAELHAELWSRSWIMVKRGSGNYKERLHCRPCSHINQVFFSQKCGSAGDQRSGPLCLSPA